MPAIVMTLATIFSGSPDKIEAPPSQLPNVLFIVVDDLGATLGCYGRPEFQTPHLDQLARRAIRFDRAYCQFPLCNPSRSSMLSGRYPTATGVLDNLGHWRKRLPQSDSLPQYFRRHGYETLRVGKIFHDGADDKASWSLDGSTMASGFPPYDIPPPWTPGGFDPGRKLRDGSFDAYNDERTVAKVLKWLERDWKQPFFMAVGIRKPHIPLVVPQAYIDRYDLAKIEVPADLVPTAQYRATVPRLAFRPNYDLFLDRPPRTDEAREAIRAYRACVSFVDDQVGQILKGLKANGLDQQTIVVFCGDHGFHLGDKGMWSKLTLFESSARVPLMIAMPSALQANVPTGAACSRTVELVDLYPTLAELCGLPAPSEVDGRSLAPLVRRPDAPWDKPAYTMCRGRSGRSVRNERYRYTEWDRGASGVELYDHDTDPGEVVNRANDQKLAEVQRQLHEWLLTREEAEGWQPTEWRLSLSFGSRASLTESAEGASSFKVALQHVQPGKPAWQVKVSQGVRPVTQGQTLTLRYRARAQKPRSIVAYVNQSAPPWDTVGLYQPVALETEWRTFEHVFKASRREPQAVVNFGLGESAGDVEFADVTLTEASAGRAAAPTVSASVSEP